MVSNIYYINSQNDSNYINIGTTIYHPFNDFIQIQFYILND